MARHRETSLLRGTGCAARLLRDWYAGGDLVRRLEALRRGWERGPFRSACRAAGLEPEAVDTYLWHRRRTLDGGRPWPTPRLTRELVEGARIGASWRRRREQRRTA